MSSRNLVGIGFVLFGSIASLVLVAGWTAHAGNGERPEPLLFSSCKNVKFKYKNGASKYIQVTKVKYYNSNERRWQTETIPFNYCSPNQDNCTMPPQDLRDSESDNITSIVYEFKTSNSYTGPWSGSEESREFHPDFPKCKDGKMYGSGTEWVIAAGGSGGTTNSDVDCKGVSFKITNGRAGRIKLSKLSYFNLQAGEWRDEQLNGDECLEGQTCTVTHEFNLLMRTPISLKNANGHDITKVKFIYKFLSKARGSKWTSAIDSKIFEPIDPRCQAGREYGTGQKWTIGNN